MNKHDTYRLRTARTTLIVDRWLGLRTGANKSFGWPDGSVVTEIPATWEPVTV